MAGSTTPNPRALLAALLAVLAVGGAAPALAGASATKRIASPAGSVRDYWTAARMRAADPAGAEEAAGSARGSRGSLLRRERTGAFVPAATAGGSSGAPVLRGSPGAEPDGLPRLPIRRDQIVDPTAPDPRSHGKIFFTIPRGGDAGDYVCSGTAINSRNRSVVWTAGHCVFDDAGGGFATNWIFVPGYGEGVEPFGEWPARKLAAAKGWRRSSNLRYDLGAAVVRRNAEGQRLGAVVGGRGIGFDQPRDQLFQAFGYPAVGPPLEFTGEHEFRCTSNQAGTDQPVGSGPATMAIDCDLTAGASGGGWVGGTTLLSVTSYGYDREPGQLYGPYLSASAKALYKSVRGKRRSSAAKGHGAGKR